MGKIIMTMHQHRLIQPRNGRLLKWALGSLSLVFMTNATLAYLPQKGGEFSMLPPMVGDQINPQISMGLDGGYVVWEDNAIDGNGTGIAAARIDSDFNLEFKPFLVNQHLEGDQSNPKVATNQNGFTLITWEEEGTLRGRILNSEGSFVGDGFEIGDANFDCQNLQIDSLGGDGFVAAWESDGKDGHRLGVYAQVFDNLGSKMTEELAINQNPIQNQRSPDVLSQPNGEGFLVSWISEVPLNAADDYSVSVWTRSFDHQGNPQGDERQLTDASIIAANPSLARNSAGQYSVVFSGMLNPALSEQAVSESWEVYAAPVTQGGNSVVDSILLTANSTGSYFSPQIVGLSDSFAVAWAHTASTMAMADIQGVVVNGDVKSTIGQSSTLNSNLQSSQIMPVVAMHGENSLIAAWSSYEGGEDSFELKAQRYEVSAASGLVMPDMSTPYAFALGFDKLGVSWPALDGFDIARYEVYVDDKTSPITVDANYAEIEGLTAGSDHSIRLVYVTSDGIKSPFSQEVHASTWGSDNNRDGLPDNYQTTYWGGNTRHWEGASLDSDADGLTNLEELMAGTNPLNARSVLHIGLERKGKDLWLSWEMQPGGIYQIESSSDLFHWSNAHGPILATEFDGGMPVDMEQAKNIYRVVRLK